MTKRKSKSNSGKILEILAASLGLIALLMIFVNTIKIPDTKILGKAIEGTGYTGLNIVFGLKENDVAIFSFSIMALIPYLLVIGGIIISISNAAKKTNKGRTLISAILFAVAGVFYFLMPNFIVCASTLGGKVAAEIDYVLTTGAIISAITSLTASLILLIKVFIKK